MLLDFPTEIIQLILRHSATSAFLQAAFSCRTLLAIASNCREVLLHHLYQTPGLNKNLLFLNTTRLFQVLIRRSSQQLYRAQFTTDCACYSFGSYILNVKASSLTPDHHNLALVFKGQEDIYLFRIENGELLLKTRLKPAWPQQGTIEVLRTAFDSDNGLHVLQRFTPAAKESNLGANHPFVRQALQACAGGRIYLSRYPLQSSIDPIRMCSFPDHAEYEPLALAAAHRDTFAISWQHLKEKRLHEVVLYTAQNGSNCDNTSTIVEISYDSCLLVDGARQQLNNDTVLQVRLTGGLSIAERGPITHLAFNDRSSQLLYYYRAQTLYGSFQRINMSSFPVQPTLYDNLCRVQFTNHLYLNFSIAIPFYGTHETQIDENGISRCHWKYLAFGIATHHTENWTIACLLRSEAVCSSLNCGHVLNLERGRRFSDWMVVARLWGYRESTNSLGCIVTASKLGTRVAVANWNVLYIWAVQPSALIGQNTNGFYPSSWWSPKSGVIELRPIVFPLNAVCFKIRFIDEDEMIAITDRGLMRLNFGPLSRGQRMTKSLADQVDLLEGIVVSGPSCH
ncbi:hypothetical protein BDV25DRAFT_157400 [Aspergillus avenaceus]|uniref:F-box domain-containing protein n=1 Tax=Aspergillus avenaceus TaxID=36643 RepID=A0A5N6TR63_ASPAV|nr:hypothetical protein BDV25DRAFT_157400 [Aspergillus avenaceus]